MCPGIKFDCVPVLDGEQGIGKSSIVKDLVTPEYYSESLSLTDMDDKAGAEKLQGFWVVEIGELAGMKKADIEKVKSFLSTSDDKYRPSYGRVVESHPRQCIIIGTVNGERGYLRDITATAASGSSRFIRKHRSRTGTLHRLTATSSGQKRKQSGSPAKSCISKAISSPSPKRRSGTLWRWTSVSEWGRGISEHLAADHMGQYGYICQTQFPLRRSDCRKRNCKENLGVQCRNMVRVFRQKPLRTQNHRQLYHCGSYDTDRRLAADVESENTAPVW